MLIGEFEKRKGYVGTIEYNPKDDVYYGSLKDVPDSINYHGSDLIELQMMYHEAIDRYIEIQSIVKGKDRCITIAI